MPLVVVAMAATVGRAAASSSLVVVRAVILLRSAARRGAEDRLGGGDAETARVGERRLCCNVIHDPTMAVADVVERYRAGAARSAAAVHVAVRSR